MQCPNCGTQNPEEFRFCNQCGTSLVGTPAVSSSPGPKVKVRVCPNCGGLSPLDVWNCLNCGENLDVYSIQQVNAEMIRGLDEFDTSKPLSQRFKEPDKLPKNVKETIQSRIEPENMKSDTGVTRHDHQTRISSHHYYALQGIASLCNGLAIAIAVVAGIGVVTSLWVYISAVKVDGLLNLGLAGLVVSAVFGVTFHLLLRIFAEGIFVLLDLELHTRQTALNTQETKSLLKRLMTKDHSSKLGQVMDREPH